MAQAYVRGGVHIWVGLGGLAGAPVYLGTGERAPRVSIRKRFADVRNDLGGETPFDFSYQGKEGIVILKMTRWNDPVLQAWEGVTNTTPNLDAGGVDIVGEIGALMVTQGLACPLWVSYSYAPGGIAPAAAFASLRSGWHFYATFLEGPDDHEGGTDPATEALVIRCARVYNPATGSFSLFDRDMTAVSQIN